ncbi:unknown [Prevotella sp. CAG:5226]|nr:unknown [Prevotella sp. CAG:5226]
MVVTTIWVSTKVKCCKGNTKTLFPSKKVHNLYTNICSLPVIPHVKECVCFYCHLTLFVRNKLIFRYFKSVR